MTPEIETQTVSIRGIDPELFHAIDTHDQFEKLKIRVYGSDMISTATNNFDTMLKFVRANGRIWDERPDVSKGVFRIYRVQKDCVRWFGYEAKGRGIKTATALRYMLVWFVSDSNATKLLHEYLRADPTWEEPCN